MLYELNNTDFSSVDPNLPIIFLQITKTGGLAYSQALQFIYRERFWWGNPEELAKAVNKGPCTVFAGHFNLAYPCYQKIEKRFNHVTLLQHPISRTLANYENILINPRHPSHNICKEMSLKEIFKQDYFRKTFGYDDLIGILSSMRFIGNRTCNLTQQSKFNLSNFFTFFGIADYYTEFLDISNRVFGWPEYDYKSFDTLSEMNHEDYADSETLSLMSDAYRHDIKFYNFAVDLYEKNRYAWLGKSDLLAEDALELREINIFEERPSRIEVGSLASNKEEEIPEGEIIGVVDEAAATTPVDSSKVSLFKRILLWFGRIFNKKGGEV